MMEVINVESWSLFEKKMQQLLAGKREPLTPLTVFRGHSNSEWRLETTLERVIGSNIRVATYYSMIKEVQAEIETFTNNKWDFPTLQEFDKLLVGEEGSFRDYMGYLRHHGFPSPLLDWTLSPFIAAYFAFRDLASTAESVSIYEYWQSADGPMENPRIVFLRGDYRNNKRHYLQQSVYTLCTRKETEETYFFNHEDAFRQLAEGGNDFLTKYLLPASERANALLSLEAYNINAYSLMGSEESLLETVSVRYYGRRKAWRDMYPKWGGNAW